MNANFPSVLSSSIPAIGNLLLIKCCVRLVVAADGANSSIRRMAALPTWGWNYGQEAIVATVAVKDIRSTAWQRFIAEIVPVYDFTQH